ncbi:MAG: PhoX family protein [Betaproteobacteria bacterium]
MSHSYREEVTLNPSSNTTFSEVLEARLSRRGLLKGAAAAAVAASLPLAGCAGTGGQREPVLGFTGISTSTADAVRVPQGYTASVLYAWGDPVGHQSGSPAFKPDASHSAAEQALQAGMHHDGIHYFPLPYGSKSSSSGLLVMNHEYTDDGLLHADGFANWSAEKVRKSQNAHGCSVIEVRSRGGQWEVVRPSPFARRITAATPMRIAGPAAGHALMRTAADPAGTTVLGTFNDCAHGYPPWGPYLACEENWDTYFVNSGTLTADHRRNGITARGRGYRWNEFDERFDAGKHPNEPNRHGWVVEFDPYNPQSQPVKRTALGRFSHEGAWPAMASDGRLVMYMGDDRVFEYIYKFVSRDRVNPNDRAANANLLDHGTLYAARFNDDGRGEWLPLVHGQGALTAANGFADQADVLVRTRAAADAMGATKMDRPEWIAVHPHTNEVYCTLTNNSQRGGKDRPGIDRANPRANNVFGQIIRWRETGNDPAALRFEWDLFAVAGDPQHPDPERRGNIKGDAYGSPDGLWFDDSGLLWIQTDVSSSTLNKGHYERLGNNQMLAADVRSGETRRFLTGPSGCEVTGVIMTPDSRTMFVNIQHPGESPSERSDPKDPRAYSSWPDGGRPRSATVVIRKNDGGVIGS